MSEITTSELLTTVIAVFAVISAFSWLLIGGPLDIFRHASYRYTCANLCIGFGMIFSLIKVEPNHISIWLISDVALFFGCFLYKKAVYKQFRRLNNLLFDKAVLSGIAITVMLGVVFNLDYKYTTIIISLICAITCAMTVSAKYHSLILRIPRYSAALLVLPMFLLSSILFTKSITLWFIPNSVEAVFVHKHVDAVAILWFYLVTVVLVNIFAIGAAITLLILKIQRLADHDQLTELLNRRAIFRELNRAHKLYIRDSIVFSVLLIDIDFFKKINDTKGHDAGDAAIKYISKIMLAELRETDRLARYGGEEFLAVLTHCDIRQAQNVAEKLRVSIQKNLFTWHEDKFELTVSIGVCSIDQVEDIEQLVITADKALYTAKGSGRNRVSLASTVN